DYFEGNTNSLINNADLRYFTDGGFSDTDSYPYLNQENGGNCQQAFMIAMTDGWYNSNTASNVGDYDAAGDGPYDGGEYADGFSGTLADISMDFYERDLKPDTILTDNVPTNDYDQNNQQHVVTYALAFGTPGTIDPESPDWVNCPSALGVGQQCGTWPFPVDSTSTTIDDLYHSTVNGRGLFLNAGNPQELVEALMKIKQNIEERLGSSAAVSTNSVQRQIGSKLYRGEYMTGKWSGDLKAFNIDVDTGAVDTDTIEWSANAKLNEITDFTQRKIYSFDGATGIPFEFSSLTAAQKTRLANGLSLAFGTTAAYAFGTVDDGDVEDLVNYLRGDVSNDRQNGGPFRTRASLLGDIVHSEAEYYNRVLYVGANDGMLHAFHSETGVELGAYVPNMLYGELPKLAYPQYQHQYFVNNTPSVTNTGTKILLVSPMGKGYKGLFVLDVSAPMGEAEASKVGLWEYPGAGATDPDLGYTYSYASIVKTGLAGTPWVVVTGNGYDSTNGHAVLYVFNALTGAVLKKFDTGVGGCNGLSSPAIIDPDGNGVIDYAYAGDLKGNMWKFDFTDTNGNGTNEVADWEIAFSDGTNPKPLITVTGPTGSVQPITNMPGVMFVSKCNPPGSKGYLVLFGTGKYLGNPDLIDTSTQSVYGVYDWAPDWVIKTGGGTDTDKYLGTFGPARTLPNATTAAGKTVTLVQQTISATTASVGGETYRFISDNPVNYYNVSVGAVPENGNAMGWYANLPDSGERMIRRPVIRNNIFIFVANKPEGNVCSAGGTSVFYQVDACSGGWPDDPQFDTNGDGKFDENDLINGKPPIGQEHGSMLLDITILDDKVYTPDADAGEIPDEDLTERPGARFWQIIE
ncbi:MAG: PilC/PilY family type IV pilus protein, partial [Desulfosalsimonadaceae bacterium]|nr:PilC/PilY family type IV pilus protein [Desulfosalsimonadaceae bacterium]